MASTIQITDTCGCGAAFSLTVPEHQTHTSSEKHRTWLEAHSPCRTALPAPPTTDERPDTHA